MTRTKGFVLEAIPSQNDSGEFTGFWPYEKLAKCMIPTDVLRQPNEW